MTISDLRWFTNTDAALRRCWHPVAALDALDGDGPHRVRLLGEDHVIFRSNGHWSGMSDRCPHRFAPLSAGRLDVSPDGTVLRCGYHGWCFDASGTCVEIPAIGAEGRVPPAAHLQPAAELAERYGLLWMSLEEPITPLPEVVEWGDTSFGVARVPASDWNASAAQMADNFLDVGHFPFTHTATIGDADDQLVGDYMLERTGWTFQARHEHSARLSDGSGVMSHRVMDFECTAPHHVRIRLDYGEHGVMVLLFFHQPVDEDTTRLYCIELATELADAPDRVAGAIEFQLAVAGEDRVMLERLKVKAVPLASGAEANTRADRITVELRRVLADLVGAAADTP